MIDYQSFPISINTDTMESIKTLTHFTRDSSISISIPHPDNETKDH